MSELEARQIDLEQEALDKGQERYRDKLEGRPLHHTVVGEELLASLAWRYGEALTLLRDHAMAGGHLDPGFEWAPGLAWFPPLYWATITLNVVVGHPQLASGIPVVALGFEVLAAVRAEDRYAKWQNDAPEESAALLTVLDRTKPKRGSRARRVAKAMARVERVDPGSLKWRQKVGAGLIWLLGNLDMDDEGHGYFQFEQRRAKQKTKWFLTTSDWGREQVKAMHVVAAAAKPVQCRWWHHRYHGVNSMKGGLYGTQLDFVIGGRASGVHTCSPSGSTLDAVNMIQATAWRVNEAVLQIAQQVVANGDQLGGFAPVDPLPLPELSKEKFDALGEDKKRAIRAERAAIHEFNDEREERAWRTARVLGQADKFRHESAIYWAHQIDWRGRIYPHGEDLTPQGAGLARGLLRFAREEQLTDAGWRALAIALANAHGQDKLPLDARGAWTLQHQKLIEDSVRDPFDGERFWDAADEPWLFLALAHDWVRGVSSVPCSVDATCSGIQVLSALARDPVCGRAVNLIPMAERQDLYGEVAADVGSKVSSLALAGDPMAAVWANKVTRSTVKPACMTLPYGATTIGRREQLMEFAAVVAPRKAYMASRWLCHQLEDVLRERLQQPMLLLAYFRAVGLAIARAKKPVVWTAPSGSETSSAYAKDTAVRVETLVGKLQFREPSKPESRPDVRKAGSSLAPNVVHSFDAAHLVATVNAFGQREVTAVHDSIGSHANSAANLAQVARDAFADIYSTDRLAELHHSWEQQHPDLELPLLPPRGALDLEQARGAVYLMS